MVPAGLDYVDSHYTPGPGAVVLPSEHYGVSDVMQLTNHRISQWADNRAREKTQKKAQLNKMLEGLNADTKGILDKDVPYFVKGKQDLEDFYTQSLAAGVDPDNPKFLQQYNQARKKKAEIETWAEASKQKKERIQKAQQDINDAVQAGKADGIDLDASTKAIAEYYDTDLDKSMNFRGSLVKPKGFNVDDYLRNDLFKKEGAFKPETTSEPVREGNMLYIEQTEKRDKDKVLEATRYALDNKPEFKNAMYEKYSKAHPEAKQRLVNIAQAQTNAGNPITADELMASEVAEFAYQEATKPFEYSKVTQKDLKADPFAMESFKVRVKAQEQEKFVEPYVTKWASIFRGDPTRWTKMPDGSLHASSFLGDSWGPDIEGPMGKQANEILDLKYGGKAQNGNNIVLLKTTKSDAEARKSGGSPYIAISEMSDAMYPWIAGNHNPAKVPELIHSTQVVGERMKIFDRANGKFTVKASNPTPAYNLKDADVVYTDIAAKKSRKEELRRKAAVAPNQAEHTKYVQEIGKLSTEIDSLDKEFRRQYVQIPKTQAEFDGLPIGSYLLDSKGELVKKIK